MTPFDQLADLISLNSSRGKELDLLLWNTIIQGSNATLTPKLKELVIKGCFDQKETRFIEQRLDMISSLPVVTADPIRFVLDFEHLFIRLDSPSTYAWDCFECGDDEEDTYDYEPDEPHHGACTRTTRRC
jgi:hypothetical protein